MYREDSVTFELATMSIGVSPHAFDAQTERCAEQHTFDRIESDVRAAIRAGHTSSAKPSFLSGRRRARDGDPIFYAWPTDRSRAYLVRPKLVVVTVLVPNPDSPFRVLLDRPPHDGETA